MPEHCGLFRTEFERSLLLDGVRAAELRGEKDKFRVWLLDSAGDCWDMKTAEVGREGAGVGLGEGEAEFRWKGFARLGGVSDSGGAMVCYGLKPTDRSRAFEALPGL